MTKEILNEEPIKAIIESLENLKDENSKTYTSVEELFEELDLESR